MKSRKPESQSSTYKKKPHNSKIHWHMTLRIILRHMKPNNFKSLFFILPRPFFLLGNSNIQVPKFPQPSYYFLLFNYFPKPGNLFLDLHFHKSIVPGITKWKDNSIARSKQKDRRPTHKQQVISKLRSLQDSKTQLVNLRKLHRVKSGGLNSLD